MSEKDRHHRLEAKRARRRHRVERMTFDQAVAKAVYKHRVNQRGAIAFIGFFKAISKWERQKTAARRAALKERKRGPLSQRQPLSANVRVGDKWVPLTDELVEGRATALKNSGGNRKERRWYGTRKERKANRNKSQRTAVAV